MIPTTVEALVIVTFAVAPGLLFEQGIERRVSYWRTPLSDRVLRFLGTSLLLHSVLAPLSFFVWTTQIRGGVIGEFRTLPLGLWVVLIVYLVVPFAVGLLVGGGAAKGSLPSWVLGNDLAPRAWDRVFSGSDDAFVRVRFRSTQEWIAGVWDYASSWPVEEDLLLDPLIRCDSSSGELVLGDDDEVQVMQWQSLVQRSELDRIDLQPLE